MCMWYFFHDFYCIHFNEGVDQSVAHVPHC